MANQRYAVWQISAGHGLLVAMKKSAPANAILTEDLSHLDVTILYEDFVTGWRAKDLFGRILEHLNLPSTLQARVWKSASLRVPRFMNRAVAAATESDIVILSTHAEQNRPLELEEWFVRWANARKNQPCAVVLLIDGIGRGCNGDSMLRRLENVAGISSVEIFYRVCDDEPGVVERNTQEREGEFVKPGGSLDATARRLAMEPLFRN